MSGILKNNIKENFKNVLVAIFTLISILGCISNFDIYNNKIIFNGNNFIYIIIFFVFYYLAKRIISYKDKRLSITSIIFSFIISSIYIISYMASNYFLDNIVLSSKMFLLFIIGKFLTVFLLFYIIIKLIYVKLNNINIIKQKVELKLFTDNKRSIFFITFIIFLAYIPYIIDSFPGNLTYDFAIQIRQALNYEPLVNHHPFISTKLIGLCLCAGNLICNYNIGIFIYTLIQCLANCLAFSIIIYYMAKKNVSIKYRIITLLFFILLPIFGFYSVWLTKDILFTICITMITIGMIEMSYNKNIVNSKKYILFMILFLLLSMLFRKNGLYVVLIIFGISIIFNRKNWLKILLIFCIPVVIFKVIDGPVRKNMQIDDGSSMEMYSIPAQQMARIYTYNKEDLTDEQFRKIETYILDENINQIYDPLLSDPIKAKLNEYEINNNKSKFIKFFIELAIKYPKQTLESFACTTYRFYYLNNEVERGLGQYKSQSIYVIDNMLPKDMNVNSNIKSNRLLDKIDNIMYENDIPILSTLLGSGIYVNIYIICIGYLIYTKRYKLIIGFLPVFLVLLTQLAGPVVDQRYSYSLFTCFPVLVGITIFLNKSNNVNKEEQDEY